MLEKYSNFIVKNRWYVLIIWVILAGAIVTLSPKLSSVTSDDQASFLPSSYESVQAQNIAKTAFPQAAGQTAIVVFKHSDGSQITPTDQAKIAATMTAINQAKIDHVTSAVSPPQGLSANKQIQLGQVQLNGQAQDPALLDTVQDLRNLLKQQLTGSSLEAGVTGDAAIQRDTKDSSMNAEKIVGVVTLLLIVVLPILIFRSPIAALLPLISVGIVFTIAQSLLALTAKTFNFHVSGQLTSLLVVVLFGIGTDYILFMLFRYRERLRTGDHTRGAVSFALTRAGEAILSAALVVAAAFAALFAAKLGIFSSLAPGLIISVGVMLLAAMSLVPALLGIVGDKIFWPSKKWQSKVDTPFATKLGRFVAKHPGRVTIGIVALLLVLATGLIGYKVSFDLTSQLPSTAEATVAFKDIAAAFPAGTASPTQVYVASDSVLTPAELATMHKALAGAQGVSFVAPAQTSPNGQAALYTVVLKNDPSSKQAIADVQGPIRAAAHGTGINAQVAVGGETSTYADLKAVTARDLRVIIPLAAVMIFIILAILLRSLVAPIYLLLTVGLGFAATLGATVWLFVTLPAASGLNFILPILLYIFVVAGATDYNILMMTRLREEVLLEGKSSREAAELAIEHSASTLMAAGLILAGTFGSLTLAGLSLLTQIGFGVAFGIALGAFVISLLIIPAITTLLGKTAWWPSRRT